MQFDSKNELKGHVDNVYYIIQSQNEAIAIKKASNCNWISTSLQTIMGKNPKNVKNAM